MAGVALAALDWAAGSQPKVACDLATHSMVPLTYKHPFMLFGKAAVMATAETNPYGEGERVEKGDSPPFDFGDNDETSFVHISVTELTRAVSHSMWRPPC